MGGNYDTNTTGVQAAEAICCPACGYHCLGRGGIFCVDKPTAVAQARYEEKKMEDRNGQKDQTHYSDKAHPRVTPHDIDYAIASAKQVYFCIVPNTTTTVCAVTLGNGFVVIGTSSAVSKENFNQELGESVALDKVRDKLWELLGYRLKQALWEGPVKGDPMVENDLELPRREGE